VSAKRERGEWEDREKKKMERWKDEEELMKCKILKLECGEREWVGERERESECLCVCVRERDR
jgi:hypothetical protein